MILRWLLICFSLTLFSQTNNLAKACSFNCGSSHVIQQKDWVAVKYGNSYFIIEIPKKKDLMMQQSRYIRMVAGIFGTLKSKEECIL